MTTETSPITKQSPKSTSPKTKNAKKDAGKSAKAKLAAGAEAIRKLESEAKKKKGGKGASKKAPAKTVAVEVIEKITESKEDVLLILKKRVKMADDNASLTIDKETPIGEYVRIFDNVVGLGERVQFLIGDVINQGQEMYGKKYAAAMSSTGRSIDTLKAYASAAKHIPPNLRAKHQAITYTHLRQVVKVPQLEDKREIIADAVKAAKEGKPWTVKEFKAKADKKTPAKGTGGRPKKPKKRSDAPNPPLIMSEPEKEHYGQMLDAATRLEGLIETGEYAHDISDAEKKPLMAKLMAITAFAAKFSE